jgi:tetratricopeptide (TPR) repeat protein
LRQNFPSKLKAAQNLVRRFPKNHVANFYLGVAYSNLDLNTEAINAYRVALDINPNDSASLVNLGSRLGMENQDEEAIKCLRMALSIDPMTLGAWSLIGISLDSQGDYSGASCAFRKEIAINPNDGLAWYGLSGSLYRQGKFEKEKIAESRIALKHAVSLGNPSAIKALETIEKIEASRK